MLLLLWLPACGRGRRRAGRGASPGAVCMVALLRLVLQRLRRRSGPRRRAHHV